MKSKYNYYIEKLEKLRAPSPALDAEIAKLCEIDDGNFTSSIDDARRLVPRPRGSMSLVTIFEIGGFADDRAHGGRAKVFFDPSMAGGPPADPFEARDCPSIAIALCIASLRARVGYYE